MVGHRPTNQSFRVVRSAARVGRVVVGRCSTNRSIRFRVFGREAAFLAVKSTPFSFVLSRGRAGRPVGPGLPVSLFHGIYIPLPMHLVALPMRLMALCRPSQGNFSFPLLLLLSLIDQDNENHTHHIYHTHHVCRTNRAGITLARLTVHVPQK